MTMNPSKPVLNVPATKPVVNTYGQVVLHPNLGSPLAPLATPAAPGQSAITQAASGQTAPAPPAITPAAATPPAPASPPASLGTLTDNEQRIWSTLIGNVGSAAATQAIINSRALAAGSSAINSGTAKTVTVTPQGNVTTETTTPGVTNTGKASATSTGVDTSVPVPKVTPIAPTDNYYQWTANGKTSQVTAAQYDSWTPAQQFAYLKSIGQIDSKATLVINKDGTWGYTGASSAAPSGSGLPAPTVLNKYTNPDGSVNLSAALAGGVTASWLAQNGFQQSDIQQAQTTNAVTSSLKSYATAGGYDIAKALADKAVTTQQLISAGFDSTAVNQAITANSIMATLAKYKSGDGYDLSHALAAKAVTPTQLLTAGFTQAQIDASKPNADQSYTSAHPGTYYTTTSPTSKDINTEINTALTAKKGSVSGQVSALNDAIENAGLWDNSILGKRVFLGGQTFYTDSKGNVLTLQDQVNIEWNALTDNQKNQVAGLYSQDLYRTNPFAETQKQIAVAGQKAGIVGQLATAPLTGITIPIAKAVSNQHVTAQDVEGAIITAVGDVLMVGGGEALVNGFGNAGRVITNTLLTGMGTVGVVDTVMQVKKGGTPGATIAVEAALSVAALIAGAGGLVSQIVPKDTPDVDVAQQYIDKMRTQTTPEGLVKNSPLQAPSGNLESGLPSGEQAINIQGVVGESPSLGKMNITPQSLIRDVSGIDENADPETAAQAAEVTATYKDWAQAATDYAQNEHDINQLTTQIADNRTTLDAITKGTTIPDEYTAKLAGDTKSMEKTLAKLKEANLELAKEVGDTESQFTRTMKQYAQYLKDNDMLNDDSGMNEAIRNLPHNSADVIKNHINLLMNGDYSPEAIAAQQAKVDALDQQYQQFKGKTGQSADLAAELNQEQSKLAIMKIGSLSQAQTELINARDELTDVKEIEENGKLNNATKQNLLKIQNQLEQQISDRENLLKTQLIKGQGLQDIIKIEDIKDADGNIIGKRIYSDEGVFRYDTDEDGNIKWNTKTEESTGGGRIATAPTETRPSPDTTTPEESELQQTSRGMPKTGVSIVSAIGKPMVAIPTIKKNSEVVSPSTRTETTKITTTRTPTKQPGQIPSKTIEVSPLKTTNPAVRPPTKQSPAQQQSQTQAQIQAQIEAMNQNMQQSQQQNMNQQMSKAQQMQQATQTPTKVKTDTETPPPDTFTPLPLEKKEKEKGEKTGEPTPEEIANAAVVKAGMGWWLAFGTGKDTKWKFYKELPPGAKPVGKGKGSGYRSVQATQGNSLVARRHLGVVNITINRPTRQPGRKGAVSYQPSGAGRPGLSATRHGQMLHIRGVGIANVNRPPHGRILRG